MLRPSAMLRPRAVGMRFGRVSSIYSSCFASVAGPPPKGEQSAEAHIPTDTMQEAPPLPPIQITTSLSNVKKTLKKDSKALESRTSRFHMDSVFPGVPSMKPLKALPPPEPRVTTLENGLRVATQEMYSPLCTFGVVVDVGSRDEEPGVNDGVCHMMEAMAFKTTTNRSHEQLVNELDDLGAIPTANSSREQVMMCIDVLHNSLPKSMELLADSVMNPTFDPAEIDDAKAVIELQLDTLAPELQIKELLQEAAYRGQPLGRPHFCRPQDMNNLTGKELGAFKEKHFTAENMVLAAAGVDHEEFVALARKYMGTLPRGDGTTGAKRKAAVYTGGEARLELPDSAMDPNTRVAVGFEILLGGGNSFSAGGPGKGMYSRLYREILNKYHWVEGAEAFVNIHNETGVLGIAGSCDKEKAGQLMHEFCAQFAKLSITPVDPTELSRARNMLKCNVLTQLESRIVMFEDVARQLVTYGRRESPEALCQKIESVTAIDIMSIARRAFSKPISIAALGTDLTPVPTYKAVLQWFIQARGGSAPQP